MNALRLMLAITLNPAAAAAAAAAAEPEASTKASEVEIYAAHVNMYFEMIRWSERFILSPDFDRLANKAGVELYCEQDESFKISRNYYLDRIVHHMSLDISKRHKKFEEAGSGPISAHFYTQARVLLINLADKKVSGVASGLEQSSHILYLKSHQKEAICNEGAYDLAGGSTGPEYISKSDDNSFNKATYNFYTKLLYSDDFKEERSHMGRLVKKAGLTWACGQIAAYNTIITDLEMEIEDKVHQEKSNWQQFFREHDKEQIPDIHYQQAFYMLMKTMRLKARGLSYGLDEAFIRGGDGFSVRDKICSIED